MKLYTIFIVSGAFICAAITFWLIFTTQIMSYYGIRIGKIQHRFFHNPDVIQRLVFCTSISDLAEATYISDVIFGNINRPLRISYNCSLTEIECNTIFVLSCKPQHLDNTKRKLSKILRAEGKHNLGIFLVSDELNALGTFWQYKVAHVFRNYPASTYEETNFYLTHTEFGPTYGLLQVPLGYRTGYGPILSLMPLSFRDRLCTYIGNFHSSHRDMIQILSNSPYKCYLLDTNKKKENLHVNEYKIEMLNTKFGLCPGDTKQETHRFYETIEAGAIPITVYDNFMRAFTTPNPLQEFTLSSWEQLPELLNKLYNMNSTTLNYKQMIVIKWWKNFIINQQKIVQYKLDAAFGDYTQNKV